jgi:hypothetical protein
MRLCNESCGSLADEITMTISNFLQLEWLKRLKLAQAAHVSSLSCDAESPGTRVFHATFTKRTATNAGLQYYISPSRMLSFVTQSNEAGGSR